MNERAGAIGSQVIDIAIRLALVAALVYFCLLVASPFIPILLWAVVFAVMLYPLHQLIRARMGLSNAASATLIGVAASAVILVPMGIAIGSVGTTIYDSVTAFHAGKLTVPQPPARLADLPLVGPQLHEVWAKAAIDFKMTIKEHLPQLQKLVAWLGDFVGGLASAMLAMVASLIIAAIIIAYEASGTATARAIFVRVTADAARGERMRALTVATIRGVAVGIVGVAFIQALLIGLGFFLIGLPGAGLWSLAVLVLGIFQLPALVVSLPAILIALGMDLSTTVKTVFVVWTVVAGFSDGVLKPMLLGRGLEVPMPVILLGVIGGTISSGLVGLFLGPVLLGVGYVLFVEWLDRPVPVAAT